MCSPNKYLCLLGLKFRKENPWAQQQVLAGLCEGRVQCQGCVLPLSVLCTENSEYLQILWNSSQGWGQTAAVHMCLHRNYGSWAAKTPSEPLDPCCLQWTKNNVHHYVVFNWELGLNFTSFKLHHLNSCFDRFFSLFLDSWSEALFAMVSRNTVII